MLAPPQRHKRPRSPSPPPLPLSSPDLTSPLDVLLKRRRRDELTFSSPNEHQHHHHHHDYFNLHEEEHPQPHAESSSSALRRSMKGVERRRTKQWERQNAPTSNSQPTPPSHNGHLTTPNQRNWHSQPDPIMSSSPIRNVMPSSSPFRAKEEDMWQTPINGHSGGAITGGDYDQIADGEEEEETMEEWNEDEMKKQWGEAYEKQNWLLRSLHLARTHSQPPHSYNIRHSHTHPPHPAHTPLHATDSSSSTSIYITDHTLVSPHPTYRTHPSLPDSSPFNSHHPSLELRSPSYVNGDADEDMEVLYAEHNPYAGVEDEVVRKRYEETNRLLGELAVVRQQRRG